MNERTRDDSPAAAPEEQPAVAAAPRIVRALAEVANLSPAVITPTRQMSSNAITRPRLRPMLVPNRASALFGSRVVSSAACSTRTLSWLMRKRPSLP